MDTVTITRKQVIPYLVEEIVLKLSIINRIFGVELEETKKPEKKKKTINEQEIRDKIIQETERTTVVSINKLLSNFESNRETFLKIVNDLVHEGKIIVLGSIDVQIVVTKPLVDDVF